MLQMIWDELISSALQLALLSIVPFAWWLAAARGKEGFAGWIGLKRIEAFDMERFVETLLAVTVLAIAIRLCARFAFSGVAAQNKFRGLGARGILPALINSVFHTALSEEVFFRGFLVKRISAWLGFAAGNAIQAVLFGLMHGAVLFPLSVPLALTTAGFSGAIGLIMGYMNEKANNSGSILPSWYIHSFSNFFSLMLVCFNVF
jgi:membrane protease YdiL (CAAX protease family)